MVIVMRGYVVCTKTVVYKIYEDKYGIFSFSVDFSNTNNNIILQETKFSKTSFAIYTPVYFFSSLKSVSIFYIKSNVICLSIYNYLWKIEALVCTNQLIQANN